MKLVEEAEKLLKKKNVKNESANKKELPAYILVCQ